MLLECQSFEDMIQALNDTNHVSETLDRFMSDTIAISDDITRAARDMTPVAGGTKSAKDELHQP